MYSTATNYARLDQSQNYEARRNAEFILRDSLAPNAVVIAPWEIATPLRYLQFVENQRADLLITNVSPIWPQFFALHDKAGELGRAYYNVEFNPEFKKGNVFRSVQAVPLPLRDAPRPKYPLPQKKIIGEVEVLGYDLEPDPPMPGQAARVLIYYRTLAKIFPMYSSVLNVHNILGVPVKEISSFPASVFYETFRWRAGEIYRDVYSFIAPPARGLYTLDLAWYEYDLGTHTSDFSKPKPLALGSIRVGDFSASNLIAHPTNARVGEAITFLGWDSPASISGGAINSVRGQSLALDLFWRADQTMKEEYTVFVHLVNEQGQVVADGDSPPFSGLYATNLWRAGESLRDTHTIKIPGDLAPGKYLVEIGMYLPANGNRLPIQTGTERADKIILTTLDVR